MKNIVITGTSRGIGFELAQLFANNNCNVLALSRNDELQMGYQKRIEKLHQTSVIAVEQYQKFKKQNITMSDKLEKSQEGIKVFQGYIDEYRHKIKDLEDVIAAYEEKFGHLSK